MVDYKLKIFNTSGILKYEITDFLSLSFLKGVNIPGVLKFKVDGNHPIVTAIADKWPVEVWRRDVTNEIDWTLELATFFREPEQLGISPGIFEGFCVGLVGMLNRRIVAWASGITNRSAFFAAKAETISKTLVNYNAAANATTANGRIVSAAITGLTVESDSAGGNVVNWYCYGQNLLETLQGLALIGGGDFDIVKTSATTYQFRWYVGQLGTDRSTIVTFSSQIGNMGNPHYRVSRLQEKTLAIVAGQGQGSERDYSVVQGANYNASTNNFEIFIDARQILKGDTDALDDWGSEALTLLEEDELFEFDVLQSESSLYGLDYFLGDLVGAISPFTGSTLTRKISTVGVVFDKKGRETISIGLSNE